MMNNIVLDIAIICFVMAYACYEARNDNFYRDLENKKLNVEINKFETLKGIVDMCKSLETHLKIIRENQKTIINKMPPEKPTCIIGNGNLDIKSDDEPRVVFPDKKYDDLLTKRKEFEKLLWISQGSVERAQDELYKIDQILNGEEEQ